MPSLTMMVERAITMFLSFMALCLGCMHAPKAKADSFINTHDQLISLRQDATKHREIVSDIPSEIWR